MPPAAADSCNASTFRLVVNSNVVLPDDHDDSKHDNARLGQAKSALQVDASKTVAAAQLRLQPLQLVMVLLLPPQLQVSILVLSSRCYHKFVLAKMSFCVTEIIAMQVVTV